MGSKIGALFAIAAGLSALSGCASSPAGPRSYNIPMYGQPAVQRPDFARKADEDFIRDATAAVGDRKKAGIVWANQAENFMNAGNLDFAMRRYNQSWLLDPDSYRPYWGFARVLTQQSKFEEALPFMERAKKLVDDPYQKVAVLSDTGNICALLADKNKGNPAKRAEYSALANEHYEQSVALDPKYPNSWAWWAWHSYNEGKYPEAWTKVKRARELGWTRFSESFLRDLSAKMPEPR